MVNETKKESQVLSRISFLLIFAIITPAVAVTIFASRVMQGMYQGMAGSISLPVVTQYAITATHYGVLAGLALSGILFLGLIEFVVKNKSTRLFFQLLYISVWLFYICFLFWGFLLPFYTPSPAFGGSPVFL